MKSKSSLTSTGLKANKPEKEIPGKNIITPAKKENFKNKVRVESFADINERFVESRKHRNMSQADWAQVLGIHLSMVNAIEYKRVTPNINVLRAWKRVSGVTYAWIIDGENLLAGETKGGR